MSGLETEIVGGLVIIGLFLLMLFGMVFALKLEMSQIFKLVKVGAQKEFTTSSGYISLAVVIIVSVISGGIIFIEKALYVFSILFSYDLEQNSNIGVALVALIVTLSFNFLLLGLVYSRQGGD